MQPDIRNLLYGIFDSKRSLAHMIYLLLLLSLLILSYLLFMKKYYHLHEEYLNGIESN